MGPSKLPPVVPTVVPLHNRSRRFVPPLLQLIPTLQTSCMCLKHNCRFHLGHLILDC